MSWYSKLVAYLKDNENYDPTLPQEFSDPSINTSRAPVKPMTTWQRRFAFIYVFDWYPSHYSKFEKWHVFKVDLVVTLFCALSFFTKYLDQMNITNAYVSGMKEDLSLNGNELNIFSTYYNIGYCIGQVPAMFFITKRGWARWLLIVSEAVWGICTFAAAGARSSSDLYAIRFFVGLSEAASFPGHYYIISSWNTPEELGRRAGFYNFCAGLGTMCAGYIQTGTFKSLNGKSGMEGWRWQFIIDGLITAVVVIYGILLFPGSPNHTRKFGILTEDDLVFARKRLKENRVVQSKSWDRATLKKIAFSWEFILLPFLWIFHHQIGYSPAFSVYLKAENYTVPQRNNYPTGISAVGCLAMLITPALFDLYGKLFVGTFIIVLTYFYSIVLLVWDVPEPLKFAAFYIQGFWSGLAPAFYAWAAIICKDSAEKKGIILALMNSYSYATQAWTIPLQWNTKYSPRFTIGWAINTGNIFVTQVLFYVIYYLGKKEHKSDLTFDSDIEEGKSEGSFVSEDLLEGDDNAKDATDDSKENDYIVQVITA